MVSSGAVLSLFAQLNLIPMPRDMKVSEGECRTSVAPKVEAVAAIPPEGYELSITPDGVTIRHSDDAGLFYARMTLKQLREGAPLGREGEVQGVPVPGDQGLAQVQVARRPSRRGAAFLRQICGKTHSGGDVLVQAECVSLASYG